MRRSYRSEIIENEKDQMTGFYFGYDYCAEHERGISEILKNFGVNTESMGVEKRKITVVPQDLLFVEYEEDGVKRAALYYDERYYFNRITSDEQLIKFFDGCYEIKTTSSDETWLSTAWSNNDFCIYGAGEENTKLVKRVYKAFKDLDIVMYTATDTPENPYAGAGLMFLFESMMDEEEKQELLDFDLDQKKIKEKASTVLQALKEAGKGYYACSPEWFDKDKETLKFFLNPRDQRNCYWGWVTEQDLWDWIEGKGVIPGHGKTFEHKFPDEYEKLQKEMWAKFK